MIHVTQSAQEYFYMLLSKQEKGTQIRVFVINPGSNQAECGISYCFPSSIENTDTELKFDKIMIYIDLYSLPYLKNSEIDLIQNDIESQIILKAPYITKPIGYNNKSLFDQVENLLQLQINSKLAYHGGYITLIEITHDMWVIVQFSGGCNGCTMINHTLKEGIEKILINNFPNIRGIRDITKHQLSEYSYYQ